MIPDGRDALNPRRWIVAGVELLRDSDELSRMGNPERAATAALQSSACAAIALAMATVDP